MAVDTPILDTRSMVVGANPHTTTSAAPTTEASTHFSTKQFSRFRLYADFTSVTALNVVVWNWDAEAAKWFVLGSSDDIDPFVPTNGDEARDFFVGRGQYVYVQVATLTGTSVQLRARGIDSGIERT